MWLRFQREMRLRFLDYDYERRGTQQVQAHPIPTIGGGNQHTLRNLPGVPLRGKEFAIRIDKTMNGETLTARASRLYHAFFIEIAINWRFLDS